MQLFSGKSLEDIREITFKIGMLGRYGLDINDPKSSHVLKSLPGEGDLRAGGSVGTGEAA